MLLRKEPGLSHPDRSTPLHQAENCSASKTNMLHFQSHSTGSNTAARPCEVTRDVQKRMSYSGSQKDNRTTTKTGPYKEAAINEM